MLVHEAVRALRERLPPGWTVGEPAPSTAPIDAVFTLGAPDRQPRPISLVARASILPRQVLPLVVRVRETQGGTPFIVVARFLSREAQRHLRSFEASYLDLTGNARLVFPDPGLFVETLGSPEDPDPKERRARSLRGRKTGRIVRALVDHRVPPKVRELAAITRLDAGHVSRILAFLDEEALVTRVGYGRLKTVNWPSLLRRWSEDAPLEVRGRAQTFLEPRGLNSLVGRLATFDKPYAITGSLAVPSHAAVAPARLATIWTSDATGAAARLALRPADVGANVLLIEPADDVVFEGALRRDGVWCAAPSQVAADLLTSPGRGPAEAEALIDWMQSNEGEWRR